MSTSAENKDYKQLYESAIRVNNELTSKIEQLQHELNQLKKMIFGVRQERFIPVDKNQLTLDIAPEQSAVCNVVDARKVTYVRVLKEQANQGRDVHHTIPAHLRREDVILEPGNIPEGSKRIAMLYSLIGTCKLHNVNPSQWLNDILTVINDHPINRIKELLPHTWITKQSNTSQNKIIGAVYRDLT